MRGENAPSALPCYVPPVTHHLTLGTIGTDVTLRYSRCGILNNNPYVITLLTLCVFNYHTAECIKSLLIRGMRGKMFLLPCYVSLVTHHFDFRHDRRCYCPTLLTLCVFRYHNAE
jgi:hypothetical protein